MLPFGASTLADPKLNSNYASNPAPVSKPPAAGRYSRQPPARRASNFKPPAPGALRPGRQLPVGHEGSPRGSARLGPPEPRGAVREAAETRRGVRSLPRASQNVAAPGPPRPPPEKPHPQAGHWWEGGRAANGRRRRTAEG